MSDVTLFGVPRSIIALGIPGLDLIVQRARPKVRQALKSKEKEPAA